MSKADGGLWNHLQRTKPFPGTWRRVDARGMTDCIVYHKRNFFVELKDIKHWTNLGQAHLDLRSSQVAFFCSWPGEKYVLARIEGELLWFAGPTIANQSCWVIKGENIPGPFKRYNAGARVSGIVAARKKGELK